MKNSYNLIDEQWVPTRKEGLVSLKELFSDTKGRYQQLEGNPIKKLSIFKLLLAIVQSAHTPKDDEDWVEYDTNALSDDVLKYLEKHHDKFYLYGAHPFLQMPQIHIAKSIPLGRLQWHIVCAEENGSLFYQSAMERPLQDFEKAWIVVQESAFSRGGKTTDKKAVLSEGHEKKSAGYGSSLGPYGILHSFFLGTNILESLYYNMLTTDNLATSNIYKKGLGKAVWEKMPAGEQGAVAETLKNSYLGRLVPLSRFLLIHEERIHYAEGVQHLRLQDYVYDLSMTVSTDVKKDKPYKVVGADPNKKPWRNLSAFLSFLDQSSSPSQAFFNSQLRYGFEKINKLEKEKNKALSVYLWSSGIKVHSNSGEQYVSQGDDSVDSILLMSAKMDARAKNYIDDVIQHIEKRSKALFMSIRTYLKDMGDNNNNIDYYLSEYWNNAELLFMTFYKTIVIPNMNTMSDEQVEKSKEELTRAIQSLLTDIYDKACVHITAKQIEAWAKNYPRNYRTDNT